MSPSMHSQTPTVPCNNTHSITTMQQQQQVHDQESNMASTTMSSTPPDQAADSTRSAPVLGPWSKKPQPDPQPEKPVVISSETENVGKGSRDTKPSEDETLVMNAARSGPSKLCESSSTAAVEDDGSNMSSGRERLKRHRVDVAGRVWIPDMWGQEGLLKDWIDCTAFDASLGNSSIMSARASLVEEGIRRANMNNTSYRSLENSC